MIESIDFPAHQR